MIFLDVLDNYKKALSWAIGPAVVVPLGGYFSGFSPNDNLGLTLFICLITLAVIALSFQLHSQSAKPIITSVMKRSFSYFLFFLLLYIAIYSVFVFSIPNDPLGTDVILGCGWSPETLRLLEANPTKYLASQDNACPGQFHELLRSANYETSVVYKSYSVQLVRLFITLLWIGIFASFAFFLGTFMSRQTVLEGRRKR